MALVKYTRMSGAGNTFIVVDARELPDGIDLVALARAACSDRLERGGTDGFIAVAPWSGGDFEMLYFNRDGSSGMMCGNGGRCAVRFAADAGYVSDPSRIAFTNAGAAYRAELTDRGVKLHFPDPRGFRRGLEIDLHGGHGRSHFGDVGTPHAVVFVDEIDGRPFASLDEIPIDDWGSSLRRHPAFAPEGANANFVEVLPDDLGIRLRTFERGVEAETGACGTGAVSSAIIAAMERGVRPPVDVAVASGGILRVDFRVDGDTARDVTLEGDAEPTARGTFETDELLKEPAASA